MIRIWLSRGTTIPVREQLCAQLILGILSGRIGPGERLPSVRDLARRLKLHANTVSAAYQDLAKRGWVSQRRGSGVFVRKLGLQSEDSIASFVRGWAEEGLARGYTIEAMREALAGISGAAEAREFLVVDPDPRLAEILASEIGEALGTPLLSSSLEGAAGLWNPAVQLLVSEAHRMRCAEMFNGAGIRPIRLRSMQDVLDGRRRPAGAALVAVVSRSESIHRWAATLLSALGFAPDSVVHRNPAEPGWQAGAGACDIVAADVVTAAEMPAAIRPVVFRLVAEDFLAEMRELVTARKVS